MLSKTVLSNCVITQYFFGNSLYNGNILHHTTRQDVDREHELLQLKFEALYFYFYVH